jgi:hypothetical protein
MRVVPTPVLKDSRVAFVGNTLDAVRRDVTVLGPIGHHDDQLIDIDLDGVLSPVQRATLEHGDTFATIGVSHMSDDAIAFAPSCRPFERPATFPVI